MNLLTFVLNWFANLKPRLYLPVKAEGYKVGEIFQICATTNLTSLEWIIPDGLRDTGLSTDFKTKLVTAERDGSFAVSCLGRTSKGWWLSATCTIVVAK